MTDKLIVLDGLRSSVMEKMAVDVLRRVAEGEDRGFPVEDLYKAYHDALRGISAVISDEMVRRSVRMFEVCGATGKNDHLEVLLGDPRVSLVNIETIVIPPHDDIKRATPLMIVTFDDVLVEAHVQCICYGCDHRWTHMLPPGRKLTIDGEDGDYAIEVRKEGSHELFGCPNCEGKEGFWIPSWTMEEGDTV